MAAQHAPVRLAEVIAALSLATDLAMGQPMAFALRSCVLSVRLGEALGYDDAQLSEIYYQALLRYIGCNAETHVFAALFGDELALRRDIALVDSGKLPDVLRVLARHIRAANAGLGPLQTALGVARGLGVAKGVTHDAFAGHCEVAQRLAERLGFSGAVVGALGQLYERWDGRGEPNSLTGEAIAPAVRVVSLVQDALATYDAHGADAAVDMVRQRRGSAYDPAIADRFCAHASKLLPAFGIEPTWDDVLALEPSPRVVLSDAEFYRACVAMADFADLKSPFRWVTHATSRSSRRARRSTAASPPKMCRRLSARVCCTTSARSPCRAASGARRGRCRESETERVRMHVYYTERVLARSPALARLGAIAAQHHERSDGSGYHRAVRGNALSPAGKLLAAADTYQAMIERRPNRPARAAEDAATELKRESREGRLDSDAVNAVLSAAGHRVAPARRELVAD